MDTAEALELLELKAGYSSDDLKNAYLAALEKHKEEKYAQFPDLQIEAREQTLRSHAAFELLTKQLANRKMAEIGNARKAMQGAPLPDKASTAAPPVQTTYHPPPSAPMAQEDLDDANRRNNNHKISKRPKGEGKGGCGNCLTRLLVIAILFVALAYAFQRVGYDEAGKPKPGWATTVHGYKETATTFLKDKSNLDPSDIKTLILSGGFPAGPTPLARDRSHYEIAQLELYLPTPPKAGNAYSLLDKGDDPSPTAAYPYTSGQGTAHIEITHGDMPKNVTITKLAELITNRELKNRKLQDVQTTVTNATLSQLPTRRIRLQGVTEGGTNFEVLIVIIASRDKFWSVLFASRSPIDDNLASMLYGSLKIYGTHMLPNVR